MITRAARFGVLKILKKGHEQRHEERDDEFLQKAHEGADIASPEACGWIQAWLDRVEVQPWSLTGECHCRSKDGLFRSCIGIQARLFCRGRACEAHVGLGRSEEWLTAIAKEYRAGLIVMGLTGEHDSAARRPVSIAYAVLRAATVPVLVVLASAHANA